jgi:methionyl-tRNA formyltransferase
MLRYVFMGTPDFAATILLKLFESQGAPVHVFTQPARAAGRGRKLIPTAVQQLSEEKGFAFDAVESVNTDAAMATLEQKQPDLILVAAFGQILKKPILEFPKYCLNVHGSLLPKYRGAAPVQRAILNGDSETGITIQRMARKLDTGDILLQRSIPIRRQQTSAELLAELSHLGAECLVESIQQIEAGREKFIAQDEALATYASKLEKSEARIDWTRPALEIERQVYGLQPWPVACTTLGSERLQIYGALALETPSQLATGQIETDHKSYVHIGCGQGALALTEIHLENRKKLSIVDFLRGFRGALPFTHVH